MSKNKWFDKVFLPSLFEYAQKTVGMCKNCKISNKQFDICRRNMVEHNSYDASYDTSHTYYNYMWNNRQITVFRHNNAYINFSLSTTETAQIRQEEETENQARKMAMLENIKQSPERLEKSLAKKLAKLKKLQKELSEALDDNEDADIIDSIKDDISKLQENIDFLMH